MKNSIIFMLAHMVISLHAMDKCPFKKDSDIASWLSHDNSVKVLQSAIISGTIDLNHANQKGISLLHYFIDWIDFYKEEEAAELLDVMIQYNVDVNHKTQKGNTALHFAVVFNTNEWCWEKLIAAGADVNAQNNRGDTPLHYAACAKDYDNNYARKLKYDEGWYCNSDAVRILLNSGASVDIPNEKGITPLYQVSMCPMSDKIEQARVISLLLSHGANKDHKNAGGLTVRDLLRQESYNKHIVSLLDGS